MAIVGLDRTRCARKRSFWRRCRVNKFKTMATRNRAARKHRRSRPASGSRRSGEPSLAEASARKAALERWAASALADVIRVLARERGHRPKQLQTILGIGKKAALDLFYRGELLQKPKPEFYSRCARYVGLPTLAVRLAMGNVHPMDFYADPAEVRRCLPQAIAKMREDPRLPGIVPTDFGDAPLSLQISVVQSYEAAIETTLLPGRVEATSLVEAQERFEKMRAEAIEMQKTAG